MTEFTERWARIEQARKARKAFEVAMSEYQNVAKLPGWNVTQRGVVGQSVGAPQSVARPVQGPSWPWGWSHST